MDRNKRTNYQPNVHRAYGDYVRFAGSGCWKCFISAPPHWEVCRNSRDKAGSSLSLQGSRLVSTQIDSVCVCVCVCVALCCMNKGSSLSLIPTCVPHTCPLV